MVFQSPVPYSCRLRDMPRLCLHAFVIDQGASSNAAFPPITVAPLIPLFLLDTCQCMFLRFQESPHINQSWNRISRTFLEEPRSADLRPKIVQNRSTLYENDQNVFFVVDTNHKVGQKGSKSIDKTINHK